MGVLGVLGFKVGDSRGFRTGSIDLALESGILFLLDVSFCIVLVDGFIGGIHSYFNS